MLKEVLKKSPRPVWQRLCSGTPSQRAIRLSLAIHLGILLLSFGLGLMQAFLAWLRPQKPSLHVFSLESLPSSQALGEASLFADPPRPSTAKRKSPPSIQFQSLPKAKPTLSPTKEGSKPLEKPSSTHSPEPKAKAPSAKKLSYEDFLKAQSKAPPSSSTAKPSHLTPSKLNQALKGTLGMPRGDNALGTYIGQMKAAIDTVWQKPLGLKGGVEAVIEFEVDKNGKIQSYKLIKPSHHTLFDASIEKAFQSGLVLPPPPGGKQVFQLAFRSLED